MSLSGVTRILSLRFNWLIVPCLKCLLYGQTMQKTLQLKNSLRFAVLPDIREFKKPLRRHRGQRRLNKRHAMHAEAMTFHKGSLIIFRTFVKKLGYIKVTDNFCAE